MSNVENKFENDELMECFVVSNEGNNMDIIRIKFEQLKVVFRRQCIRNKNGLTPLVVNIQVEDGEEIECLDILVNSTDFEKLVPQKEKSPN